MSRKRSNTYIVVVVRAVLSRVDRVKAAFAPRVQSVVAVVVRVTGCDGAEAEMLAAHVALAALSGGALALASALTGTGVSGLLKLAGEVAVGAIAVHAAITLVRSRSGALHNAPLRVLFAAAWAGLVGRHAAGPALRALAMSSEPGRRRWAELQPARSALRYATKQVFSRAALGPAKRAVPVLGQALELMSLYRNTLDNARYVHRFALAAAETYRLPAAA
jgi:hypothetical protein